MQNKILVVDGDTRSLRLLEVSLSQVGYRVVTATSGADALGQLEVEVPDLVLADTDIGAVDGFALYQRLQARPEWAHLPFIFILDGEDPAAKLRAVQLGASDFLTKPVFLKEALSRVELLLEKHAQRGEGGPGAAITSGRERFAGPLSGTALLDLIQTMELGRKSGIAYCTSGRGQRAVLYFADGAVVDAELGRLRGEEALYRVLTFQGGEYRVELLTVVRPRRIELGTAGLLMEAMRHLEEWNRLVAALPPLTTSLSQAALAGGAGALRPEMLPRELREVLWRFDGQRSVLEVLELMDEEAEPPHDALRRLGAVAKLYAARLLVPAGRPISGEPRASVPTPIAVPRLTPPPLPPVSRLTPPPLPRLTPPPPVGAWQPAVGRPTPVALPRAVVFTPAPLPPGQRPDPGDLPTGPVSAPPAVPRLTVRSDVPTGPIGLPTGDRAGTSAEDTTGPMAMTYPSSPGSTAELAATDDNSTPLPRHFPPPARHTPGELAPVTPAARLTPPPLPQVRLTPPPLPGRGLRSTPPMVHTTPLPITDSMVQPLPVFPGHGSPPTAARLTPLPITDSMVQPLPVRSAHDTPPALQAAARLTPLPITDSMVQPLPVFPAHGSPPTPQVAARLTPLPITDSMVQPLPVRSGHDTPPALQVAAQLTPLPITDSMVEPLPVRPVRSTPPMLRVAPRLTPPPRVPEAAVGSRPMRITPPALRVAPRLTPPPLAAAPRLTPVPEADSESSLDSSASSPGRNLARLAQRLAATRQPLPFTPPPLPSYTPALEVPSSQPDFASAQMWSGGGSGGNAAAAPAVAAAPVSWIGSVPELEPISIPEFEVAAIEHSAPSWGQAAAESSAVPQRELRVEKTLSVHSRPQRIAADNSQTAVHISAPVRLPAEMASTALPPIELDPAATRPRPPRAAPPAAVPRQRLSRVVAWLAAGAALFGLGVGLFWVRQELDRSAAAPSRESTWTAPPAPSTPKTPIAEAPPAVQDPLPPPSPATAAVPQEPGATSTVASEASPAAGAPTPAAAEPNAAPAPAAAASDPAAAVVAQNTVAPSSDAARPVAEAAPAAVGGQYAALIAKARAYERRGALQPAHHAVRDAQRLNPRSGEVFALLAQLALDEGSADKAAGLAKRAVQLDANNADAYLVLGTVEQARGHSAKARGYFKKYLTLAPTGDRAHDVRAVLRMSH